MGVMEYILHFIIAFVEVWLLALLDHGGGDRVRVAVEVVILDLNVWIHNFISRGIGC